MNNLSDKLKNACLNRSSQFWSTGTPLGKPHTNPIVCDNCDVQGDEGFAMTRGYSWTGGWCILCRNCYHDIAIPYWDLNDSDLESDLVRYRISYDPIEHSQISHHQEVEDYYDQSN